MKQKLNYKLKKKSGLKVEINLNAWLQVKKNEKNILNISLYIL